MFTGIIEEIGTLKSVHRGAKSAALIINAQVITDGLRLGDSVAVNGVCLTVTELLPHAFAADVMPETLSRTGLGKLAAGSRVNLERAVAVGGRLGGHIVSGHIDGTGQITQIRRDDNAVWYHIAAAENLLRYVVEKGSIAIDGISLTVAQVQPQGFAVSVIPHTAANTTLTDRKVGDTVNLEADIVGKYIEKLLQPTQTGTNRSGGITLDFLSRHGF
ncbi:MAG: riboflavin synthase [Firmicutes bacterium]|nr:riboflavin synthase [Bacillota bacterium]